MPSFNFVPLPENANLVFRGETPWPAAVIPPDRANRMLEHRNRAGRNNEDVLRSFISGREINGKTVFDGLPYHLVSHLQIDFPSHFTEQEAALYEQPFATLRQAVPEPCENWWVNPHANDSLRRALARLEQYFATPYLASEPSWAWIESTETPDDSWLVMARDDDFTHAVLQSACFQLWWDRYAATVERTRLLAAFPFPWAPSTPLGDLSRQQQELRSDIIRAGHSADSDSLTASVAAAYGWTGFNTDDEILSHLEKLHALRMT